MIRESKLGDTVYCMDDMGDMIAYTFIASAGDFVIVTADRVVENISEQMKSISNDTFETYPVNIFRKENVYTDKREAEKAEKESSEK